MFVHDMVHNNPGLVPYESNYLNPKFLRQRGYDGKTFELFGCAQFGLLWDEYDEIRQDGKKVFPFGSSARAWAENKKRELTEAYNAVVAEGLQVSFMMDIIALPCAVADIVPEVLDENGKINIQRPELKAVIDCMFDEMFREFPQISGIYIRYGETYVGDKYGTPYHRGNNPVIGDEVAFHKWFIRYLIEKVCKEHQREIYYRTWGFGAFQYNPEFYLSVSDEIEPHENLYFCIKHTTGDFHRTAFFNQCLNIGKHQQIVEIQAAREYEGKGAYPNYIADGVINGFEEYKWLMDEKQTQSLKDIIDVPNSLIKGIWTWSRGGGWDGPYITGKNGIRGEVEVKGGRELWPDVNAYVLSHWVKDTSKSDRYYAEQYARDILGMSVKDSEIFYEICHKSAHAVLLGRAKNNSELLFDVWWTRDQNIDYGKLLLNVKAAIEHNLVDVLLEERRQSVETWEEIVSLASRLSDEVDSKEYIVETCHYGRILYSLYEIMFVLQVKALLGAKEADVEEYLYKYESLWQEWKSRKENYEGFPTLYIKENRDLDLIGYSGNRGFDVVVENLFKGEEA